MKIKLTLLSTLLVVSAFAKIYLGVDASKLVSGADKVIVDDKRQTFSFVHFGTQPASGDHNALLKQILKTETETSFQLYSTETDKLGWTNYRYYQLYKNVRVEGAVYYVHVKDGRIISVNGEYYAGITANVNSTIPESSAVVTAKADLKSTKLAEEKYLDQPLLVLFRDQQNKYHLCWKVDAWSLTPMSRYYFFVDANTGKIIGKNSRICDNDSQGTAVTAYNGTQTITTDSTSPTNFRLFESGRNIFTHAPGPVDITDNDNFWNNTINYDNFATDAHWGVEKTHDYYLDSLGRLGQDGLGLQCNVQAHDGMYVNAYWTGTNLAFGDGDASQYYPLTSMEIVAHEYTHGVTQYTAGLVYAGESGALNESFSDVFGSTMRFVYSPPSVRTWFIGDQIVIPSMGGTPFRDMSNPNAFQCADTYGGLWWNNGDIVHYDSGVQNYWYYLLVTGGSGTNDIGNTFNVSGIGLSDAIQIAYRNLAVYLTPNATFADAANFGIQSAEDLYGACSNQEIQTANAWYAVGVGTPFTGVVTAAFTATPTVSCSAPVTVTFTNNSWNAASYQWDFGDGNNSTATSPTHTYTLPGNYNVTLIATGTGNCIGADTLVINSAVTVYNVPGPVAASCSPATTAYCCGYGITNVNFNTINFTSQDAADSYSDFTCADSTLLVAGNYYPLSVSVNPNSPSGFGERVSAWIDYNNDGVFNNTTELMYSDTGSANVVHSGLIYTPLTATLNTRLRMRVISDALANTITSACYSPQNGQVEDYMVYFVANSLPPVAMFTSNFTTIPVGSSVNFNDLTLNAPTSWQWVFTAGSPASSTTQNPTNVVYNTAGIFPVKLVATNGFGSDSVTQTTYIHVVNSANICQSTAMTSNSGSIYDSGGPNGNYTNNENCSFLIDPCGTNLQLTFSQFDIEYSYDYLSIYDGTNSAAPLIGSYTGNAIPPVANSTSGSLFLVFTSDYSIFYTGFAASWTSTPVGNAPVANFTSTPASPVALLPVQFTDQSSNSPTAWLWDFGDLGTSTFQNPSHTYASPGIYTVTLIATNCVSSDTTTILMNILPNGIAENLIPASFSVYPNPAQNLLHVSFTLQDNENVKLQLTDITGKLVREINPLATKGENNLSLNLEGIDNGIYFLNIYSNGALSGTKKVAVGK
jgi:Zn-dependent metalloprotease